MIPVLRCDIGLGLSWTLVTSRTNGTPQIKCEGLPEVGYQVISSLPKDTGCRLGKPGEKFREICESVCVGMHVCVFVCVCECPKRPTKGLWKKIKIWTFDETQREPMSVYQSYQSSKTLSVSDNSLSPFLKHEARGTTGNKVPGNKVWKGEQGKN